jgi:LPS sulfotransferase NodH
MTLEKKRFLIIGMPRSGSNWAAHFINQFDGAMAYSEVLSRRAFLDEGYGNVKDDQFGTFEQLLHPARSRARFLDTLVSPTEDVPVVGAKLLYAHCCWPSYPRFTPPTLHRFLSMDPLSEWIRSKDVQVITLVRENLLKQLVSRDLARRDGVWAAVDGERTQTTISLDRHRIVREMERLERRQNEVARWAAQFPPQIIIRYEDSNEVRRHMICEALGLPLPEKLVAEIPKQTPDHLDKVIENYDEIATVLSGTRFEAFLR